MSRGESYGGGQSSLGYLFGTDGKQKSPDAPPPSPTVYAPPYGIDSATETPPPAKSPPVYTKDTSNDYPRAHGQNSGTFISGRPSTRVKSAPGGDSSLGYLFGDKSS